MSAPIPIRRFEADRDADGDPDLGQLKRLLLVDERRQIEALRRDVSALDRRLGSEDGFCRAVADSLVVALKVTEVEQHRELANVMAPIVVAGIRREIAGSKDVMIEALYPLVGRLVTTAVANALRQLTYELNRRLESTLSLRRLRLRLKALLLRRPYADLVLAEALQDRIERLLLLDRATGGVLAVSGLREDRVVAEENAPDTVNLLGGLMSAIIEFANHALTDVGGELRSLDLGGQTVLLRASPLRVIAAVTAGPTSPRLEARVDEAFLAFIEGSAMEDGPALATLHGRLLAPAQRPWNRRLSALTLLVGLSLAGLAWGAFEAARAWQAQRAQARALEAVAGLPELAGFPVRLDLDPGRATLTISGLVPNPEALAAIRARARDAVPDYRLAERVAVLSETPEASRTRAALQESRARIGAVDERAGALDGRAEALEARTGSLEARTGVLAGRAGAVEGRADDLAGRTGAVEERVRAVQAEADRARAVGERLSGLSGRLDALVPAVAALEGAQRRAEGEARTGLDGVAGEIDRLGRQVAQAARDLSERVDRLDTPRRRLVDLAANTALFFARDAEYRDPEKAAASLDALAQALRADPEARLRVIGFGDSLGSPKTNQKVARLRADRVMADLAARGIAPARLRSVATPPPVSISDDAGHASANRRVTFDLAYPDE